MPSIYTYLLESLIVLRRGRHIDGAVLAVRDVLAVLGAKSQTTGDATQVAVSIDILLMAGLLLPGLAAGGVRVGIGGPGSGGRRRGGVVQAVSRAGLALSSTGVETRSLPAGRSIRVALTVVEKRCAHHLEVDAGRDAGVVHGVALGVVTVGHASARRLGFAVWVYYGVVLLVLLADLRGDSQS